MSVSLASGLLRAGKQKQINMWLGKGLHWFNRADSEQSKTELRSAEPKHVR